MPSPPPCELPVRWAPWSEPRSRPYCRLKPKRNSWECRRMPNFVAMCVDKPNSSDLRAEARVDHLAYIEDAHDKLLLVGPLLSEDDQIAGSLFLVEADDLRAAQDFIQNDPFKIGRASCRERVCQYV